MRGNGNSYLYYYLFQRKHFMRRANCVSMSLDTHFEKQSCAYVFCCVNESVYDAAVQHSMNDCR